MYKLKPNYRKHLMIKTNQKIILQKFKDIAILKYMIMANRKSEL